MKKEIWNLLVVMLIGVGLAVFSGCESDEGMVIAKVDGKKIFDRDLDDIYNTGAYNFQSFEDELESRLTTVDSLVIQQLLINAAYDKNIDENEEISRIILANSDRFLLDVMFQRQILDKIDVTEDEIKDFYTQLESKVNASHILVTSEDTARMLMDSLAAGSSFEQMAVKYSVDPKAQQNRGDIGYYVWGQLDSVFQESIWKLNIGELAEPFETKYGWHIARILDKQPNELRTSYAKMKDLIERQIDKQKRGVQLVAYRETLEEKYVISVDSVTCNYLLNKRENLYPPSLLATLPKNDFDPAQLDGHERELVLATWDGGQITLGQYLAGLRKIPANMSHIKPDLDNYEGVGDIIFQLEFNGILSTEARRLGIENDPEFKRKMTRFKELAMADIMQNDSLVTSSEPDEGEIRQYYDENQGEFLTPERVHLFEILFDEISTAKTYKGKINGLDRFKQIAAQYTVRSGMKGKNGDMGWIDSRQYPRLFEAAKDVPVDKMGGPIQIGSKHSIIWVAERIPEQVQDFLAVKNRIRAQLSAGNQENAFGNWVEDQKESSSIDIDENNVRATIDNSKYETE